MVNGYNHWPTLDEIEDFNFVNFLKTDKIFYKNVVESNEKKWNQTLNDENDKVLKQYLKIKKLDLKFIVFSLPESNEKILNKIEWDKKIYVDLDYDILYRKYCSENFKKIFNNYHELINMLKHQPKLNLINPISFYQISIKKILYSVTKNLRK